MKVKVGAGAPIELGATEAAPTIGIVDYSRRVTDDFGVTTVVERGFARRMSVRIGLPTEEVDSVQQLLADLRATEADWIADDDIAWLQTTGFYKDFAVDLALPPLSYCTLEVEGLAESAAVIDGGEDPAPDGQTSTLQLLQPLEMTPAWLVAHNVPEIDAPAWAIGTVYPLAYRVIRAGTHRIYESLIAGNTGHVPETSPAQWLDVGPTNRWAMFDQALGTATTAASPIVVTIDAPGDNAIALLDVTADTVRVQATDYDRTEAVGPGPVTFLDLPEAGGQVIITVSGAGALSIGTLLVGRVVGLGITEASPSAGITDFSRKEVDEFGEVSIVQRAWAKKMTARALIATEAVDVTADRIAAVRARPALWIADAALDSLIVYGFFRDFGIEIGETISKLSLSIEGLSKAQALEAPWAADIAAIRLDVERIASDGFLNAGEKPQVIIDRTAQLADFDALDDRYVALGSPGDITPARDEAASKVAALGVYLAGLAPSWTDTSQDTPINAALYQQRWVEAYEALAIFQAAVTGRQGTGGAQGPTGPQGVQGPPGPNGEPTYIWVAYADSADGTVNFTNGAPGSRTYLGLAPNKLVQTESSNPADYSWSKIEGPQGPAGAQGATGPQGAAGSQGPQGPTGAILYTWFAYADSADGTVNFTTGTPGTRTYIGVAPNQASASEGTDPAAYTWSLIKGTNGIQGPPGPDGAPTYIWLAYADSADGTVNFTTGAPGTRTYLGLRANMTTATESTNPADYFWSLIKGADGSPGSPGAAGAPGSAGPTGPQGPPGPTGAAGGYAPKSISGPTTTTPTLSFEVALESGQSIGCSGSILTVSNSNGGNVTAQVQASVVGSGTWSAFSMSDNVISFGAFEPGQGDFTGSFTNSSGSRKVYNFRCQVTSTAAVSIDGAASFFKLG